MRPHNSTYWVFIIVHTTFWPGGFFDVFQCISCINGAKWVFYSNGETWRNYDGFMMFFVFASLTAWMFGKLKSLDLDRFQSRTRTCWVWHWHVESQTFTRLSMRVAHAEVQVSLPSATEGHLCGRNARPQWSRKRPEVFEPMVDRTGVSPVRLPFLIDLIIWNQPKLSKAYISSGTLDGRIAWKRKLNSLV